MHPAGALSTLVEAGAVVAKRNVIGHTCLQIDDAVNLPTAKGLANKQAFPIEGRQFIGEDPDKTVPDVPVGVSIVGCQAILLRRNTSTVGVRRDVQIVRPCVAGLSRKPVVHTLTKDKCKAVVLGPGKIPQVTNGTKKLIWANQASRLSATPLR